MRGDRERCRFAKDGYGMDIDGDVERVKELRNGI